MTWYEDWFGEEYLRLYQHRDEREAQQQLALLAPYIHEPVLDIACGSGRHLAQHLMQGRIAFGIDLSAQLLQHAVKHFTTLNLPATIARADMRSLPFSESSFRTVTSLFTSFGYFENDAAHLSLLKEWNRVLAPGGMLLLDYMNRDQVIATLQPYSEMTLEDGSAEIRRRVSEDSTRVIKEISLHRNGSQRTFLENVRLYTKQEVLALLEQALFTPLHIFGDFSGEPHDQRSPRLIVISQVRR